MRKECFNDTFSFEYEIKHFSNARFCCSGYYASTSSSYMPKTLLYLKTVEDIVASIKPMVSVRTVKSLK